MKSTPLPVVLAVAVLLGGGCSEGRSVLDPAAPGPALQRHSPEVGVLAGPPIAATGEFEVEIDFTTLILTPQGNHCLLEVEGHVTFTGTLVGEGDSRTVARVFATCPEVAANPPGTFPDVFRAEVAFTGIVDGEPVEADMVYRGRAEAGGQIDGRIHLSGGLQGVLQVDGQLAVGGSYAGRVVVR